MSTEHPFSSPRNVTDISDCYFYHVMNLPGYGEVGGQWDLRGGEEAYLGGVSFQGKSVLELGTASGYLCRYMEGKGADVIGFDLPNERSWDLVPFVGLDLSSHTIRMRSHIEKLKNGWWFAHRLFGSRAKVVYGNIYEIPEEIGHVDIATFGSILLHLRDPFQALHSALRLTREVVVVTEVHPDQPADSEQSLDVPLKGVSRLRQQLKSLGQYVGLRRHIKLVLTKTGVISPSVPHPGCLYFVPNPQATELEAEIGTWWCFPPEVICRFLGVLGFGNQVVTEHFQTFQGKRVRLYTVVGKRTRKS
jgi:hypothetical protein